MKQLILASNSPRRKEIMTQVGLHFQVHPSHCEEVISSTIPKEVVMELSSQKAMDVFFSLDEDSQEKSIVIGSDTVVAYHENILGKPASNEDAFQMLSMLQNNTHSVYTGVTLVTKNAGKVHKKSFFEETQVTMTAMSNEEIRFYIESGEPADKAGAYGIQGRAAAYISNINGDYYNVMGLPICRMLQELATL